MFIILVIIARKHGLSTENRKVSCGMAAHLPVPPAVFSAVEIVRARRKPPDQRGSPLGNVAIDQLRAAERMLN
jgi:hypothetical protein